MSVSPAQRRGLLAAAGALVVAWVWGLMGRSYGDFHQPATGIAIVPPLELAFDLWFLCLGATFVVSFSIALSNLGAAPLFRSLERSLHGRHVPALLAIAATALAALVRHSVLQLHVVADEEDTLRFVARTLLEGRVVNPMPAQPEFFTNPLIVLGPIGWFGKSPLLHPLLLAAALVVGAIDWVTPLLCGLTTWLTWRWGRTVVGPRRAVWAAVLLVFSPHFVWTHATLASQTSSCCLLMAGCLALHAWQRRRTIGRLLVAGGVFALVWLTRPMPGSLLVLLGLLEVARVERAHGATRAVIRHRLAVFAVPAVAALMLAGAVHRAQTGDLLSGGYRPEDTDLGFENTLPVVVFSIIGAVLRENFWLFGWPLSLAPVACARPKRGALLLWGMVASAMAYRLLVPRTFVATTGPLYLLEAVPALALLAADGVGRLRAARHSWPVGLSVVSALAVSWVFYVPVQAASILRGIEARAEVFVLLEKAKAPRAVVFGDTIAAGQRGMTWARAAPNPSPRLDDDLLFFRLEAPPKMQAFAAQFGDRPAFVLLDGPVPQLLPLDTYAAHMERRRRR